MGALATGLRRASDRLLSVAAVVGALALVAIAAGLVLGVRPVFLTSGSMAPTLPTGTLGLMREVPASAVEVGDVVCVTSSTGQRVTHRVVGVEDAGATRLLTLQGDANRTPDPQPYAVTDVYRLVGSVPHLGYLVGWASSPTGLLAVGALAAGLLVLVVRGGPGGHPRSAGRRRSGGGKRRAVRGAAVGAAVTVIAAGPAAQAAPWTDATTISGTTLTAVTVPPPATFTCGGLGVLSVTFTWSAVAGATSYTLHYGSGGSQTATIAGTSATVVAAIAGGTAWVVANRAYGSTTWSSVASTTRTYTVAVVSLCS